jgi:hypothetical protein
MSGSSVGGGLLEHFLLGAASCLEVAIQAHIPALELLCHRILPLVER